MAIYHYSSSVVSRGSGRSVIAAAAYRAGQRLVDERTGLTHDYSAKGGVAHNEIMAPQDTPAAIASDRAALWNAVEAAEKRRDAQTAREVNVALPKELSLAEQIALMRGFIQEQYVARGMIADFAIHTDDANNPHAHILLTMRAVGADGFGKKQREWNAKELILEHREAWARHVNLSLERGGHLSRVDHRSLADQGIDRIPTFHLGPAVYEMEARGIETQKGEQWRNVVSLNEFRQRKEARAALVDSAINHLMRHHSTFTERDIMRYVTKRASVYLGATELRIVVEDTLKDSRVVALGVDSKAQRRYSTHEMVALEKNALARAEGLQRQSLHAVSEACTAQVLARHVLSGEQEGAVRHLLASHGLALVQGVPGSGKTTMLRASREAWEEAGFNVIGATFTGRAARGLTIEAGIRSHTLHSLLYRLEHGHTKLNRNTVVVVDEAGMVGSCHYDKLLWYVEQANAKLVAVGDSQQLQSIEAGGLFRVFSERLGCAELKEIRRQRDDWAKQAVREFARGEAQEALTHYHERGLITYTDTKDDAIKTVFADWHAARVAAPEETAIVLAGTRREVRALNEDIRANLVLRGELSSDGVRVETANGTREFAPGDQVLILRNNKALDINNGELGKVETVQAREMRVRFADGRAATIDTDDYPHVDYGYAMTIHKAQGITTDRAFVVGGFMHDRELTNVSMSRTRYPTRFYLAREAAATDREAFDRMAERMAKSNQKKTTLDYTDTPNTARQRGVDYEH